MIINEKQTDGCDRLSRVYGNMFNALQELMQDEEKMKELTPIDYSAIGLYIGKFVEQEINSSVVQLMRKFRGIAMPEYYCKRYPVNNEAFDVFGKKKTVRLNEQKDFYISSSLRSIPLGDAYYTLLQLMKEDSEDFFDNYPWLSEKKFLESWRKLFLFRNSMAHIGELIDADVLKENLLYFQRFLDYMPDILELKKELAPDEYIDALPMLKDKKVEEDKPYFVTTDNSDRPYAPIEIAKRFCELNDKRDHTQEEINEMNGYLEKYNILNAVIFEGADGKKGLKDCLGKMLVPAKYDGFGFIPNPIDFPNSPVIAIREDKYYLVATDGSGKELTKKPYDEIRLFMGYQGTPYVYREKGLMAWGLMDWDGNEICDCIIDNYYNGQNSVWFESGDKQGYWQFDTIFLPPIYDNIEMEGGPDDPLLFTLDGIQGYVNWEGKFISISDYKKYEENEEYEMIGDLICEQYDF